MTKRFFGVMMDSTGADKSETLRKSLEVTMPTRSPSFTTGMPEIFKSCVSLINSPTLFLEEMVIGSLTTPLSNFLTKETSFA